MGEVGRGRALLLDRMLAREESNVGGSNLGKFVTLACHVYTARIGHILGFSISGRMFRLMVGF